MGNNIVDLSNLETWDLIKELQNRGYNTELLWCREDVQRQVDDLNEDRESEGKEPLVLTDDDKDEVLEQLSYEYHCQRINEEIYDKVQDYLND
jgi:hypothetical protein